MKDPKFKFDLKQEIEVSISGERGIVSGRLDSLDCKNQYQVRYKAGDGRGVTSWFFESELKAVSTGKVPTKKTTRTRRKKKEEASAPLKKLRKLR